MLDLLIKPSFALPLLAQKSFQNASDRKSLAGAVRSGEIRTESCPDFSKMCPKKQQKLPITQKAVSKIPWLLAQKTIFETADLSRIIWYTQRGNFPQFDARRGQKQAIIGRRQEIYPHQPLSPHAVAEGTIRLRILKALWIAMRQQALEM